MCGAITVVLVCDGTSDNCIEHIFNWFMASDFPETSYRFLLARNVVPARDRLHARLQRAIELYEPDLLLCHRDAERTSFTAREHEILQAANEIPVAVVPVIPVRMIEAWLIFDEQAIRAAADNKNGQNPLGLPKIGRVESLNDPKQIAFDLLRAATGLPPQRLRKFNVERARSRIAAHVHDWTPLRALPAFAEFENALRATITALQ